MFTAEDIELLIGKKINKDILKNTKIYKNDIYL